MSPPHITSSATSAADDFSRAQASLALDDVDINAPIIGRRDVALIPWIVISLGALGLAIAQMLRPVPGGEHSPSANAVIIGAGLSFSVGAAILVGFQETRWGSRLRGSVGLYLLAAGSLQVIMVILALLDQGLATVALMGLLLVAPFLGLIFPSFWLRLSIGVMVSCTIAIQLALPVANTLEAGSMLLLVCVGWAVGYIPRYAHQQTTLQALLLSRSDQLTGALNRRGFLDQLDDELSRCSTQRQPIALLVIDLNGFKLINDSEGHAAGDQLLAWVGATTPTELPPDAGFGRMGGDEFAVVLPGATALTAHVTAQRVCEALVAQVGVSIGVATSLAGQDVDADALMHAADAALYAAKNDPTKRVQVRPADSATTGAGGIGRAARRHSAFTFAQLQAAGGAPRSYSNLLYQGKMIASGFWLVAFSGVVVVAGVWIQGGDDSIWQQLLRYLGIPWILACAALAVYYQSRPFNAQHVPVVAFVSSSVLIGVGVAGAALASGTGAMMPITAGLFLKAFFDSALATRRTAYASLAFLLGCWGFLLAFGPPDALWVAPFQLPLLLGCFAFGTIGYGAFAEAIAVRLQLAHTDGLTQLKNRRGFEHAAGKALAAAADSDGHFAVIVFDLDNFKGVNDTLGHAAGDELLCSVAQVTTDSIPNAYAIGRIGGDEFAVAVSAVSLAGAAALADLLNDRLESVTGGSIGCAAYPDDGGTLDDLLKMADHRAYAVKKTRTAGRMPLAPPQEDPYADELGRGLREADADPTPE